MHSGTRRRVDGQGTITIASMTLLDDDHNVAFIAEPGQWHSGSCGCEHAAACGADQKGILALPCIGDGRQSGTSARRRYFCFTGKAAAGGGLALLKTGDRVRIEPHQGHGKYSHS